MNVTLTDHQAIELRALIMEAVRDMSHEIAATDNSVYRRRLAFRRRQLDTIAELLRPSQQGELDLRLARPRRLVREAAWTAEILFTEDEDRTRADARVSANGRDYHGWGRALRNPMDPDVPSIGEELAAARALADLSHQLVDAASHEVETFEGHPVRLNA
jgi:Rv2632c-like